MAINKLCSEKIFLGNTSKADYLSNSSLLFSLYDKTLKCAENEEELHVLLNGVYALSISQDSLEKCDWGYQNVTAIGDVPYQFNEAQKDLFNTLHNGLRYQENKPKKIQREEIISDLVALIQKEKEIYLKIDGNGWESF